MYVCIHHSHSLFLCNLLPSRFPPSPCPNFASCQTVSVLENSDGPSCYKYNDSSITDSIADSIITDRGQCLVRLGHQIHGSRPGTLAQPSNIRSKVPANRCPNRIKSSIPQQIYQYINISIMRKHPSSNGPARGRGEHGAGTPPFPTRQMFVLGMLDTLCSFFLFPC